MPRRICFLKIYIFAVGYCGLPPPHKRRISINKDSPGGGGGVRLGGWLG